MRISDVDIRKYIIRKILTSRSIRPGTVVIEELDLCQGESRVDLAVINGILAGIEIKSERDNLERLERQIEIYGKNLDKVHIFVSRKLLGGVINLVPEWWGITELLGCGESISDRIIRRPQKNPKVDPFSVVQLLWRNEALNLLKSKGLDCGVKSKPRHKIWEVIVQNISIGELRSYTRLCLKNRENWRFVYRHKLSDDLCPL